MPAFAAVCGLLTALILFCAQAPARAAEPFVRGGDDADENGRRYWAASVELVAPKVTR
jgi:hypothetical protein